MYTLLNVSKESSAGINASSEEVSTADTGAGIPGGFDAEVTRFEYKNETESRHYFAIP
jgi:hypothetical protein